MKRRQLYLLMAPVSCPAKDLVAMTLGGMCQRVGVLFDTYYAADHREGGLFAPFGSTVIGGHHGARIARALACFDTTVVRLQRLSLFDSLFREGAREIIEGTDDLPRLYATIAQRLGLPVPQQKLHFDLAGTLPAAFYPDCVAAEAMALPCDGTQSPVGAGEADAALACVKRHAPSCSGVDLYEPVVASHMLARNLRERRLILPYTTREQAVARAEQMLALVGDRQKVSYGRWFGDPQLLPLAKAAMAYNVVEPNRSILSVFSAEPVQLPQPEKSWVDAEPDDAQLRQWASERKILASWVLHSGELSHDDSVLAFLDWSSMTKVRIGAGVHWQRYHFDPDVMEPMHTPVEEGGVLGLVEPVLHSAGSGIIWESAGDPACIARLMRESRANIAAVAGERFAPRGIYCFGDHHGQGEASEPGAAQVALWKAVRAAGFEYLITSVLPGESRVLFRDGDFVVLNQAGAWHKGSPFVRGEPRTYAKQEQLLVERDTPGWMVGAIDTPIHGCPIYVGRPYVDKVPQPRINEFYDYVERGGESGRVVSATPRTIARYARLLQD